MSDTQALTALDRGAEMIALDQRIDQLRSEASPAERRAYAAWNDARLRELRADNDERQALRDDARFSATGEGRYRLRLPEGVEFDADRLRRDGGALWCELVVRCSIPGAATFDGVLSAGDLNLSSVRARSERGAHLAKRAKVGEEDIDFGLALEELAQRIIAAEREGSPAVVLKDVHPPGPDSLQVVEGFPVLLKHATILFGDGGSGKSYYALWLAGLLVRQGVRVLLADWELAAEDHRDRLGRLFGDDLPAVEYVRVSGPLVHEAERLRGVIRARWIDYVVCDSLAFGCDDAPENAATAARYFQALRALGPGGSLLVAHITKGEGSDHKPFGSAFWHNGARSTWFCSMSEPLPGSDRRTLGLVHRKANTGRLRDPLAYAVQFTDASTTFQRIAVGADTPELVAKLSVRQRLALALRSGEQAVDDLAEAVGASAETVSRTARRYRNDFQLLPGGRLGLKHHA